MAKNSRIFLSPPHMGGREMEFVREAFESNYLAPIGPQVDAFEKEFAEKTGTRYATAVSSGTAALHLALRYIGVGEGDEVLCPTFTFIASANAILYLGGRPVFVDSEDQSWNINPQLFIDYIRKRAAVNQLPKAVVLVHLYGQAADIAPIQACCDRYGVCLIEDAAEALGGDYRGQALGSFGQAGIYSFNGNKIITGSTGGMIVSDDGELIKKVKFWATQARDQAPHYEHSEMGYNYRMSNVVAAICRGQLEVLELRVQRRREIFFEYRKLLGDVPGIRFMPIDAYGKGNCWLTCILVDEPRFGAGRETIQQALEEENIETRPLWKPMHMQPLFKDSEIIGGEISEALFASGLCLPSGTAMRDTDLARVAALIKACGN